MNAFRIRLLSPASSVVREIRNGHHIPRGVMMTPMLSVVAADLDSILASVMRDVEV
jgi:hypothetical protein